MSCTIVSNEASASQVKKTSRPKTPTMFWTDEHDKLMCREILAVDPFTRTRKGTVQRGGKWKEIVDNLIQIENPKFKIDTRAVRDRYTLLSQKLKKKLREEEKASGIDTEMTEVESALEDLIERENASVKIQECESDAKIKEKDQEKQSAEDVRTKAMERLGQTQKRKGNEGIDGGKSKKRSNGSDTLLYLREKSELQQEIKKEEIELKKKELELHANKHDDLMKIIIQQQQQQSKQTQDFQAMMLAMMSRFGQK